MNPLFIASPTLLVEVTTSASTSVPLPVGQNIRICNTGSVTAYVHVTQDTALATVPTGTAAQSATTILAGEDTIFSLNSNKVFNISAITASGSTNLTVQVGEGV
jgi:hypothetical protein